MFACCRVEAIVGQHQALDWLASYDVRLDDFVDIGLGDLSIPDGFRIHHDVRAMFALIQTAGLVGSYFALEAALRKFLFE